MTIEKTTEVEEAVQTDTTEETSQPLTTDEQTDTTDEVVQEPYISKSQSVGDELEESLESGDEDGIDDSTDESETSDSEIDEIIDEVLNEDDESTETSDGEEKTNTQKRIDRLTAERKAAEEKAKSLEERLIRLEEREKVLSENKTKTKDSDELTPAELTTAIKQFMEEGDYQGVLDVIDYKLEQQEKKLVNRYDQAERQKIETAKKQNLEWQSIISEYSPENYENESLKNNPDFNIGKSDSLLYKTASDLFSKANGGLSMKGAVQEAFIKLLRKQSGKSKKGSVKKAGDKETEGLKNRLAKEQRKKTVAGGKSSSGGASTSIPKETDDLADAIAERKKFKNERAGAF